MNLFLKRVLKITLLVMLPFSVHGNTNTFSAYQVYNFCMGDPAAVARIKDDFAYGKQSLLEQAAINNENNIAATICDAYIVGYVDGLYVSEVYSPVNSNIFYATAKAAFINYMQNHPQSKKLSAVVVMSRALLDNDIIKNEKKK